MRLDWKYVYKEFREKLITWNESKLFTIKQLFTRPGNAIRDFIEGKRVNYIKPFSLFFVTAALFAFLYHYFNIDVFSELEASGTDSERSKYQSINLWITGHYSFVTVLTLPLFAIGSYTAFRKQGYNYIEHLVLNTFIASQRMIVHIATFPLLYIYNGTNEIVYITRSLIAVDFVLMVWVYQQFFNKLTFSKSILKSIISYAIFLALFLVLMGIALLILDLRT